MDRRVAWTMVAATFATLAAVLHAIPPHPGAGPMPWWQAIAYTGLLLTLMAAQAFSYAAWTPHSPNRILVNEFLTRSWFGLFGLLVVSAHGDTGPLYLVMASGWAVAAWCTHYLVLRLHGAYRPVENLAQLGLFLVGLALMGLMAIRLAIG
jgi:hypothetical protein